MNLPLLFVLSSKSLAPEKGSSWIFPIENVNQRSEGGLRRMSGVTVRRVNVRRFGRLRYPICRAMETALVGPGRRVDVGFVPAGLTRYVAVITGRERHITIAVVTKATTAGVLRRTDGRRS